MPHRVPSFAELPDSGYIRESNLIRSARHPERPAPIPFSSATLWRHVRAQKFPQPVKLSERVTAWRVGEVRAWLAAQQADPNGGGK